jgi:SAM-dependent methyltransferase
VGISVAHIADTDIFSRCFSARLEQTYTWVDRLVLHFCFHVARELPELAVVPEARYLFETVRDILQEEGFAGRLCPPDESARLQQEAREQCPDAAPIFGLIERCHDHAAAFLGGRESGLNAIFPRGDMRLWERVHRDDAVMSIYADLIPPALAHVLSPGGRVLEVGAGVGAVLDRCLPLLCEREVAEYRFTDLGKLFVQRREPMHPNETFLRFAVLDLDLPLAQQGVEPASFDAVVGVNVLHSAKSLETTLRELRSALREGGHLILGEGSPPRRGRRWRLDVVFAFLRGWWDVSLDPRLRPRPGFLFPSEWMELLQFCGYRNVTTLPGEPWFREACRGGLLIAEP